MAGARELCLEGSISFVDRTDQASRALRGCVLCMLDLLGPFESDSISLVKSYANTSQQYGTLTTPIEPQHRAALARLASLFSTAKPRVGVIALWSSDSAAYQHISVLAVLVPGSFVSL